MPGRILVVDDDRALRRALARALELEGYEVEVAEDGIQALSFFEDDAAPLDAVVLDILMPNLDGLTTCRAIRASSRVPILMLTARQEVDERVEGLDAGADDYLAKPFAVVELMARVRALVRRTTFEEDVLRYGDLELDRTERRVHRAGRDIDLTRIEFSLLELFMLHPRKVMSRATIFQQVWGYDLDFASNSLEVYVGYLRRKTETGGGSRVIQTIRGVGYVLRDRV
ncbi:MAG: response regulator transcription factor [Actinomycetota bacterium]|nr:response regulator transcription factor [Actinomycetota bacterium]